MAGFISQATIDEVTARTDIVRVVSDYVPLVQKGNDWWGCCPFHHEKTASFSVSSEKKFYYCFGCHAGGTAINFIMEMEKLSYPEAVTFLARKQGIQIQYSEGGLEQQKEDPAAKLKQEYTDLYTRVAGTFHYMLTSTDAGAFALDYITKRGISMETIQKFKLGYSPRDRFWLKKFLLEKNYSKEKNFFWKKTTVKNFLKHLVCSVKSIQILLFLPTDLCFPFLTVLEMLLQWVGAFCVAMQNILQNTLTLEICLSTKRVVHSMLLILHGKLFVKQSVLFFVKATWTALLTISVA